MKRLLILMIACTLVPVTSDAKSRCEKLTCDEVKEDIRNIEARMRSGYTRSQGENYEAKLRVLKKKRNIHCR